MGQNGLTFIPTGLFRNLTKLRKLLLFSNSLTKLCGNDFDGLVAVNSLLLNNNILREFDATTFHPLRSLAKLRLDSNKLQFLPHGCLDDIPNLAAVKLDKNPWHCDCKAIYLARFRQFDNHLNLYNKRIYFFLSISKRWLRSSGSRLWDGDPLCRGPGDLGGYSVGVLRFDNLCDGQWASMVKLSPRLPIKKQVDFEFNV